jgi:hypothetical protein
VFVGTGVRGVAVGAGAVGVGVTGVNVGVAVIGVDPSPAVGVAVGGVPVTTCVGVSGKGVGNVGVAGGVTAGGVIVEVGVGENWPLPFGSVGDELQPGSHEQRKPSARTTDTTGPRLRFTIHPSPEDCHRKHPFASTVKSSSPTNCPGSGPRAISSGRSFPGSKGIANSHLLEGGRHGD